MGDLDHALLIDVGSYRNRGGGEPGIALVPSRKQLPYSLSSVACDEEPSAAAQNPDKIVHRFRHYAAVEAACQID